jgi:hypothetical protein
VVERNRGTPTWEEFVKLVNQRFGPPLRGNALGELIQLRRTSSVAEYQNKFLSLVTRCEGLIEKHQVDIFAAGLGNPLKSDVELEHPTTLEDAMALARTYKQRLVDESAGRNPLPACATRTPQASSKPLLLAGPPPQGDTGRPTAPRFKRLTPTEMAAKRECGECYNCIEKFSREHLKVCPVKGVFLLQMEEDNLSMEETEVDPLISLNAITGISKQTLQLPVTLAGATICSLIDSGSTHSFISATVARRLNLHPSPWPGPNVAVANGDRVASDGVCSNTLSGKVATQSWVLSILGHTKFARRLGQFPTDCAYRPRQKYMMCFTLSF